MFDSLFAALLLLHAATPRTLPAQVVVAPHPVPSHATITGAASVLSNYWQLRFEFDFRFMRSADFPRWAPKEAYRFFPKSVCFQVDQNHLVRCDSEHPIITGIAPPTIGPIGDFMRCVEVLPADSAEIVRTNALELGIEHDFANKLTMGFSDPEPTLTLTIGVGGRFAVLSFRHFEDIDRLPSRVQTMLKTVAAYLPANERRFLERFRVPTKATLPPESARVYRDCEKHHVSTKKGKIPVHPGMVMICGPGNPVAPNANFSVDQAGHPIHWPGFGFGQHFTVFEYTLYCEECRRVAGQR